MTFAIPELQELIDQTEAEVAARLLNGPLPPRSVLKVLSRAMAGLSKSAHGHLEFIARQVLPDLAEGEYLERHASLRGVARRSATFAAGTVTIEGSDGSSVPSGARLQRADGQVYETLNSVTLTPAGVETASVQSILPGLAGNAGGGTRLTLQTAFPGIASVAVASSDIDGGTDQETDEVLRGRVLRAWRERPQAGTESDYVTWALEAVGITRAWAMGNSPQLGSVTVFVVADANTPTIAPTPAQLSEVEGLISERRPITARALVAVPALEPLDLTLHIEPDTSALRAAVTAAIHDRISIDAVPGGAVRLSRLREAISTTPGETFHELTLPATDPVAAAGTLLAPGAITWS